MKKEGGKYAHLNEDLHLLIEVYSEVSDCYARLSHAVSEVQKFLSPVSTRHLWGGHSSTFDLQ